MSSSTDPDPNLTTPYDPMAAMDEQSGDTSPSPATRNDADYSVTGQSSSEAPTYGQNDQARAAQAVERGLIGGTGMCARGANNILSVYVNGECMGASGADARNMGPILETRYNMSVVTDTGVYQNGDSRILTGAGGTQHMETYMNGRWYSDHAQRDSYVNNSRYDTSTLYRLPNGTADGTADVPAATLDEIEGANANLSQQADSYPVRSRNDFGGAVMAAATEGGYDGSATGVYSIPDVGSKVWVFFHGGDIQKPVYFAQALDPASFGQVTQGI